MAIDRRRFLRNGLLAGSTVDGFTATASFKVTLTSYDASTGTLAGKINITKILVGGRSESSVVARFSGNAHFTSGGGFDVHISSGGLNVKFKGDYKRHNGYISGTLIGTYTQNGKSAPLSFSFDLSERS